MSMSADTNVRVIPDIRAGDRITVRPGTLSRPSNRRITRPCTIEVTAVQDAGDDFAVTGLVLTKLGSYSAAGALDGRNRRTFAITPGGWDWHGEAPDGRTVAALVDEAIAVYGLDRRDAHSAVMSAVNAVRAADVGKYGTPGNVPGWSAARNQPTEAGASVIREVLAQSLTCHVTRAASSAVRLGCPRTIDPAGRLVFTDGHGRGWVLQLRSDHVTGAAIVGTIAPGHTVMHELSSRTWPSGVPVAAGDAAIARRYLRDTAEPATVLIPEVGQVPALGAYLRPVALACAGSPTGRWLVVVWRDERIPMVWTHSDESTQARALANQAVSVFGTRRVYLARRSRYGTTVYARTGEGATFGTLPDRHAARLVEVDGHGPRRLWDHVVRGDGSRDPQGHAANVREAQRRVLGLPDGAGPDQIGRAVADQVEVGDQPWLSFLQAYVHIVGDPVGHRR